MDNIKDDKFYAKKIIDHIDVITKYINDKSYDEFLVDEELIDAIMFRLIQLIENIKNISEKFKQENSNIPWGKIIGFRNGIVHEYGQTDYLIVYETITEDILDIRSLFEKI